MSENLAVILIPLSCYLLGAVPFGLLVARAFGIEDIRKLGSGNIGATNVWRIAGAKAAVWVFIFDIGKGAAAVLLGKFAFGYFEMTSISIELLLAICGMTAVVGHMFPVYLKFKGGKGVNTTLGVLITILPLQTLISFGAFVITLALSRYVSLGSIIASLTLCAVLLIERYGLNHSVSSIYLFMAISLALLVIIAHRKNISRLLAGTESRFSFSRGAK
ncbi:MAG TPA: glycerol-3-phosphate 1-O-acyltransferase PlsY [candidate division Zixibacteria bacterium]|nr:glycerol-3-phosphate 1-O-acyltransferase PlsY [candidate division Zixibacteria bacterium]